MYIADPDLRSYVAETLTDAQLAFRPDELHLAIRLVDQRCERRFHVDEAASLYSTDPIQLAEIPVQIVDVSRRGLGIRSWLELRRGSNVRLHLKDTLVMGEVCYCEPVGDSFQVGILVESVLRRA